MTIDFDDFYQCILGQKVVHISRKYMASRGVARIYRKGGLSIRKECAPSAQKIFG